MGRKNRGKTKKPSLAQLVSAVRAEMRSIIRQLDKLRKPLPATKLDPNNTDPEPRYLVEGTESYEEIQEQTLRLAGSVWHLKDRLKKYIRVSGLKIGNPDATGNMVESTIEDEAAKDVNFLLCGDLFNRKKHEDHDNRSGYDPILGGFHLVTGGLCGIYYDGATKQGQIFAYKPTEMEYWVDIISTDGIHKFGNALMIIARAFCYWLPLIHQLGILVEGDKESESIIRELPRIEGFSKTNPFPPGEEVLRMMPQVNSSRRLSRRRRNTTSREAHVKPKCCRPALRTRARLSGGKNKKINVRNQAATELSRACAALGALVSRSAPSSRGGPFFPLAYLRIGIARSLTTYALTHRWQTKLVSTTKPLRILREGFQPAARAGVGRGASLRRGKNRYQSSGTKPFRKLT
jgi:hypothetical protein